MNTTTDYFNQAELSLAAYSNLTPGMTTAAYEAALKAELKGSASHYFWSNHAASPTH